MAVCVAGGQTKGIADGMYEKEGGREGGIAIALSMREIPQTRKKWCGCKKERKKKKIKERKEKAEEKLY